jgi:hypothetical protein
LLDWLDNHGHERLYAVCCWFTYWFGRCFICNRLMMLHSPWARYICERTSLPIEITEKGWERLEDARRQGLVA